MVLSRVMKVRSAFLRLLAGADRSGDPFSKEDKSLACNGGLQTGQPLAMRGRTDDLIKFSV